MSRKAAYFISDLHLGARYISNPHDAERRVVRFLDSVKDDAAELYLVGDVLDYWFEYRHVVPRGYVRFFGKLAELADSGVKITWLIGNHDIWIFDYLPHELGIEVVDGSLEKTIQGKRCFITHGDGVGKTSRSFRFIRAMFRNKVCQRLYAAIHPRWTVPFAYAWSSSNRDGHPQATPYNSDVPEPLFEFAAGYSMSHPGIDYYIFGHRHIFERKAVGAHAEAIILGEWINMYSYVRMENGVISMHYFEK